jgi:hypothetical protein
MDAKTPSGGLAGYAIGAGPIAILAFGADNPKTRRKVYYFHELGVLPTFLVGSQIALNPARLDEHFRSLEAEGAEEQLRKREIRRAEAENELRRVARRRRTRSAGRAA